MIQIQSVLFLGGIFGTDWMGITSKKSKAESVENFSTDSALSTLPFITFTPYHLYTLLPLHVITFTLYHLYTIFFRPIPFFSFSASDKNNEIRIPFQNSTISKVSKMENMKFSTSIMWKKLVSQTGAISYVIL